MATNYFIKEKITPGNMVKIFVSFYRPVRFQALKFWAINRILAPWIRLEVRKEIKAPDPVLREGVYPTSSGDFGECRLGDDSQ